MFFLTIKIYLIVGKISCAIYSLIAIFEHNTKTVEDEKNKFVYIFSGLIVRLQCMAFFLRCRNTAYKRGSGKQFYL